MALVVLIYLVLSNVRVTMKSVIPVDQMYGRGFIMLVYI